MGFFGIKFLFTKDKNGFPSVDETVFGDPCENRTRDTAMKGVCLNSLEPTGRMVAAVG